MGFYRNKHTMFDGNVLLYTTSNKPNPIWQMRCKFPKQLKRGYVVQSTGLRDFSAACAFVQDFYLKSLQELREGIKLGVNRGFTHQFEEFMDFNRTHAGLALSSHVLRNFDYFGVYWSEYFGDQDVQTITTSDIESYKAWRHVYWTKGPGSQRKRRGNVALTPSVNTMRQDRQRLKQFFRHLVNHNIIRTAPLFIIPNRERNTRRKVGRRDHFTRAEWNRVSNRLNSYAFGSNSESKGPAIAYQRRLLYFFAMVSANLGTRPGETRGIRWRDIVWIPVEGEDVRFRVEVRIPATRKTGKYTAVGQLNCTKYLRGLRALFEDYHGREPNEDDYVFTGIQGEPYKYPAHTFRKLLREWGEYEDSDGRVRNLYSLRGLHITLMLEKGLPVHTVAKACGTSVKQIERHYDRSGVNIDQRFLRAGRHVD